MRVPMAATVAKVVRVVVAAAAQAARRSVCMRRSRPPHRWLPTVTRQLSAPYRLQMLVLDQEEQAVKEDFQADRPGQVA
jgi:hypothetical protein